MNITGIAISLVDDKIIGSINATCTAPVDWLNVDIPLPGLKLCGWSGTIKVNVQTGIPGQPLSGWVWQIGTDGAGDEFSIVLPPVSDLDGDGDVDSGDLGLQLSSMSNGGTDGAAIGMLLAEYGQQTATLCKVGLFSAGAGQGAPKVIFADGQYEAYEGDCAKFRIKLPVVSAEVGTTLAVTVNVSVSET